MWFVGVGQGESKPPLPASLRAGSFPWVQEQQFLGGFQALFMHSSRPVQISEGWGSQAWPAWAAACVPEPGTWRMQRALEYPEYPQIPPPPPSATLELCRAERSLSQLHSPPHSPRLTHGAFTTVTKQKMRCIPITPVVTFRGTKGQPTLGQGLHLHHRTSHPKGEAEKVELSRFPMAILISSLTIPNQCSLSALPSPPPPGEADHGHGTLHHLILIQK